MIFKYHEEDQGCAGPLDLLNVHSIPFGVFSVVDFGWLVGVTFCFGFFFL